jgi:hypothetical protein
MFGSSNVEVTGAPEILDGPQHSAPRSWNNVRRWARRKHELNTIHRERPRPGNGNTVDRHPSPSSESKLSRTSRQHRLFALTALHHALVILAFSIPVALFVIVANVPEWYAFEADYWVSNNFTHCNFNGKFTLADKPTMSLWDPSGFFYINVSWGKMAFSNAKCIDVVWDIVIGHGGQALLAWVTFHVSAQYLALAIREAPVSYNTFESLAFVPPSVTRTWRLAGDLLTNRGWRARLTIVWIVWSSLFVLSFSSLITAMSGYASNLEAAMPNHDGDSVLWSNFVTVQFTIRDAERFGHIGPLFITMGDECVQEGFLDHDDDDSDPYSGGGSRRTTRSRRDNDAGEGKIPWDYVPANCTNFWHIVQYVHTFGLLGSNNTASNLTLDGVEHQLQSPTLDIITSYSPTSLSTLAAYLEDFESFDPPSPRSLASVSDITDNTRWVYDNETYPLSYVLDNASCQWSKLHNWGFSFLFLFITSLLLAIWSVGTYLLWLYTHLHSTLPREPPGHNATGGIFRSSWTLAEAMKRDFGPGAVTPEMNECDVRGLIKRRPGRFIHGVGDMNDAPPLSSRSEKNLDFSTSPLSAEYDDSAPRLVKFRGWLPRSSCPKDAQSTSINPRANSVFTHADSPFSSTSRHPILGSPAAPGRTMTMTSRLSSLVASPVNFTDTPPEFGFSAAEEDDILDPHLTGASGASPAKARPRLSLSRALPSSSHGGYGSRRGSVLSPSSAKWLHSPSPLTPSEDSSSTISPIREKRKDQSGDDGDAVRWRNDLGDD